MSPHVHDRLSAYLDGEVSAVERASVEGHLRECAECNGRLGELAAVDERARTLPIEAPEGYFDALPSRVRRRLESRARRWQLPVWTLAAAAALVLAVVTPLTFQKGPVPLQAPQATAPAARPEAAAALEPTAAPPPAPAAPAFAAPPATFLDQASRANAPGDRKERERDRFVAAEKAEAKAKTEAVPGQAAAGGAYAPEESRAEARPAEAPRSAALNGQLRERAEQAPAGGPPAVPAPEPAPPGPAPAAPKPQRAFATEPPATSPPAVAEVYDGAAETQDVDAARTAATGAEAERARRKDDRLAAAEPRTGVTAGKKASGDPYQGLLARTPRTAADARALRESWLAFLREGSSGPRADEARVRAIEAAVAAWRLGGDPKDLATARRDAAAYLERPDAAQAARVRAILNSLDE